MNLTRTFPADQYASAFEAWSWLDLRGKQPLFSSLFGDVCFDSSDGLWWLDTLEGTLTQPWESREQARVVLSSEEGRDLYLLEGLVMGALRRGVRPGPEQIYVFVVPPILGGQIDADQLDVIDFVVGLHITGQLHEQVKDFPPGTPVSGVTVHGEPS